MITLHLHICNERRGYNVIWEGPNAEADALKYITDRGRTHAVWERESDPVGLEYGKLLDYLYPTCEHGLSEWLCEGPNHYPSDNPYFAWI